MIRNRARAGRCLCCQGVYQLVSPHPAKELLMTVLSQLTGRHSQVRSNGRTRPRTACLRVERLEERTLLDAVPPPPIYQNPFMAPNNFSEIHLNSFQTDTTS